MVLQLCACRIPNDIPYPKVQAEISDIKVEGMCAQDGFSVGSAIIDKEKHHVQLYVDDSVDPAKVHITDMTVTNDAKIVALGDAFADAGKFPDSGFADMHNDITMVDIEKEIRFDLQTWQSHFWTVDIEQIVRREVEIDGQVGNAVIDPVNRNVIIYVSDKKDLSKLKVRKFSLGGRHGKVVPDPTQSDSYDFSELTTKFHVQRAHEDFGYIWTVYVYKTEAKTEVTAKAFARTVDAIITGTRPGDESLLLEYKEQSGSSWKVVPAGDVQEDGINYTATIKGLEPSAAYVCRAKAGSSYSDEEEFTTTAKQQLENSSLDDWYLEGTALWNPWAQGGSSYWDTGNRGATTVGASNSTPSDDTSTGSGKSAFLQSKFIVIKFAAGNIFTGQYVKTDGTNGVLDFGRPFCAFPTKLTFDYKYSGSTINRIGSKDYEHLKDTPDECQIYIALADWDQPFRVRTKPSDLSLFSKDDPNVIAYGEFITSESNSNWTSHTITLDYKYNNRTPKYILVVCSSSRYGDFFTGGDTSALQIDNFNLIYE